MVVAWVGILTALPGTALWRRLKAEGRALIYISHVLGDVLRQSDDVLVLRDGAVVASGLATDFDEAALIRHMVGRALETVFPPRSGRSPGDPALEVCGLTRRVQDGIVTAGDSLAKGDRSPVTLADLTVQAVISRRLAERFPGDALLAEEDDLISLPHVGDA